MNLETFNLTVVPTLEKKHKVTEKGFYMKFRLQSIYKTEFPYNNEYERYFVIGDNVYKLSDSAKIDINQAFKQESDCNDITYRKTERTTLVNVPFDRFILVNEQVTDNLIIVEKDRTTMQELKEEYQTNVESLEWSKANEEIVKKEIQSNQNTLETTQNFYDFIGDALDSCKNTLISKGREYTETNWLDNFEEACKEENLEINCENLLKILNGYRLKHKVSINKIHRDIVKGKTLNINLINEKYGDFINFMLIEQAIILKYNHINKLSF